MAHQQTAGAIAGLYEFAPQEESEAPEVSENGHAPELELAEAWEIQPVLFSLARSAVGDWEIYSFLLTGRLGGTAMAANFQARFFFATINRISAVATTLPSALRRENKVFRAAVSWAS